MLSPLAKQESRATLAIGLMLTVVATLLLPWLVPVPLILTFAGLAFYRDPQRRSIPSERHVMVSPADGRVTSVHPMDHVEAFDGPGTCVRVFLSIFNVHVVRAPMHGRLHAMHTREGGFGNAMRPSHAASNHAVILDWTHPTKGRPVAQTRLIAGMLARTISVGQSTGSVVQRGERLALFKLGSTVELVVPAELNPQVRVQPGDRVTAGESILLSYTAFSAGDLTERPQADPAAEAATV